MSFISFKNRLKKGGGIQTERHYEWESNNLSKDL